MAEVFLRRLTRWQAETQRESVADLYAAAHRDPVSGEAPGREDFLRRFAEHDVQRPGFEMVIGSDPALAGCCYGYPLDRADDRCRELPGEVPDALREQGAAGGLFLVAELLRAARSPAHPGGHPPPGDAADAQQRRAGGRLPRLGQRPGQGRVPFVGLGAGGPAGAARGGRWPRGVEPGAAVAPERAAPAAGRCGALGHARAAGPGKSPAACGLERAGRQVPALVSHRPSACPDRARRVRAARAVAVSQEALPKRRPASPLAQSWFTWARSLASGWAFWHEVPGPPPDISSLQGPS